MSTILTTDFTKQLSDTKTFLDRFFRIPLKEDAAFIIKKMKSVNTERDKSVLGDYEIKLLEILNNDRNYIADHPDEQPDGTILAKGLSDGNFSDIDVNNEVIEKYEKYVNNFININELDRLFLKKLNKICTKYKSSSDYMERLVKRLLKTNFNYTNDELENIPTRVLILRHFIDTFGYNCVEEICDSELELIVKSEFGGDTKQITDDIFNHIGTGTNTDTVFCANQHIDALIKLQGTILYKSSTICMSPELCSELCSVISEEIKLKILTDAAFNGTAVLLRDCFYNADDFTVDYFDYKNIETDAFINLNKKFKSLHTKGKKEKKIPFSDMNALFRASVLVCDFGNKIALDKTNIKLLNEAFPSIASLADGKLISDCLTEEEFKSVNSVRYYDIRDNKQRINAINEFVIYSEKKLSTEDENDYREAIYKKISSRYNGATNTSKRDGLVKDANELLDTNTTEHKLLAAADILANAKFSGQGKTREYLYIFAIAFGMTASGYNETGFMDDENQKKDPGNITDIQKNLFYDYFSDNIINKLPEIAGNPEKISSDIRVSGYGINYKNFAEIAFLWCLEQKELTAKQKIKTAYKIINYCKINGKSAACFEKVKKGEMSNKTLTEKYADDYKKQNLATVEDLQNYLIKNYPCKTDGNVMRINENGRTAGKIFVNQQKRVKDLLNAVEEDLVLDWESEQFMVEFAEKDDENKSAKEYLIQRHYLRENRCKKCSRKKGGCFPNCYAYFEEYSWIDKRGRKHKISSCKDYLKDKNCEDDNTFKKALKDFIYFGVDGDKNFEKKLTRLSPLCIKGQADLKKILEVIEKRLSVNVINTDEKDVSRTAIISLCYLEMVLLNYLYRSNYYNEEGKKRKRIIQIKSFEEYYKQFCEGRFVGIDVYDFEKNDDVYKEFVFPGANKILQDAGYQKISSKNILDVYVIFLAFKDNYKNIFTLPSAEELIKFANNGCEKLKQIKREIEQNKINEQNISKER